MPPISREILEANLKALAPATRAPIEAADDGALGRMGSSAREHSDSVVTPDGRSVRLHSARDPVAEAEALLEPYLQNHPLLLIVIGLGLGYVLEALERLSPETNVLAVEPAPVITRAMLERRDWREWLVSGRLTLVIGPDYTGATDAWKRVDASADPPPVVVAPAIERLWPEAVARAKSVAQRIVAGARANEEARRRFAGRYLLNTLTNLPTICTEADVSALFDAFKGMPAVVVAAGPSLDNNLDALRTASDRAVIVAVDTAVRPLLAAGIRPHVVTAVDPSEANARHLTNLPDAREIWFVGEGSIDADVFPQFCGRTFTFKVSNHEPWPWLAAHGIERGRLQAWGSVLTTAYDFAIRAGCDPIVFAGADLAYTDGLQYCRNTVYEPLWSHLTTTAERAAALVPWLAERRTLTARDVHGRSVVTTPAFVQFRDWLVARAHDAGRLTLNATSGGILHGPSVKVLDLAAWAGQQAPADELEIRGRLAAAWNIRREDRLHARQRLETVIAQRDADSVPLETWLQFTRRTVSAEDISRRLAGMTLS
jgi:hypothetical protein